jgi:hypothetical protein
MSRINKQTKKAVLAKQFTKIHKGGGKGPSRTVPKHGKKATYNNVAKKAKRPAVAKPVDLDAAYAGTE